MNHPVTIRDITEIIDCKVFPVRSEHLLKMVESRRITGISTDSRNIHYGNLFVAIKGDSFDGHDFVASSMEAGAVGALVSEKWAEQQASQLDDNTLLMAVEDVLYALQNLAIWYRKQFDLDVIGITGSSGKTTTKDMTAAVLGVHHEVLKTPGNLNSQLGLPQVMFQLDRKHNMAVLEMGMNHAGEIDRLAEIANPSVGVITNVGPVHLENLGTLEGVARAKGELLDHLSDSDLAVLNADDPLVMSQRPRTHAKLVTFGLNEYANIRATEITTTFTGSTFRLDDGSEIQVNIPGKHQVLNALAAIAVGQTFGVTVSDMQEALAEVKPSSMRMDVKQIGDITCINDAYNANPVSTVAALQTLQSFPGQGKRIAVLGDMLELGEGSAKAHFEVGVEAGKLADILITVGERARDIAQGARSVGLASDFVAECETNAQAWEHLNESIGEGDVVLIKGSRGMHMEEIIVMMESNVTDKAV